eukprot:60931-Pyramimonas_sp.AAC.1
MSQAAVQRARSPGSGTHVHQRRGAAIRSSPCSRCPKLTAHMTRKSPIHVTHNDRLVLRASVGGGRPTRT